MFLKQQKDRLGHRNSDAHMTSHTVDGTTNINTSFGASPSHQGNSTHHQISGILNADSYHQQSQAQGNESRNVIQNNDLLASKSQYVMPELRTLDNAYSTTIPRQQSIPLPLGYENQLSGKKKKEMKFAIGMSRPSLQSGPIKGLYQVTEDDQGDEEAEVDPFPEDYAGFRTSVLPDIKTRKLEDLDGAMNPFKVINSAEQLLVFREKQRELQKLEQIRNDIEHKYLYGQELLNNLSTKKARDENRDRSGMIREVASILPMKMPKHIRANSVNPRTTKNLTKVNVKSAFITDLASQPSSPSYTSRNQRDDLNASFRSVKVGGARFRTPAPQRDAKDITSDPLRYLKPPTGDAKETISSYIGQARTMLHKNINIFDKKQEITKLRDMIKDEEEKLESAKQSFQEDTQRFNTFLFESNQVGDKIENQFKDTNDLKKHLDAQIHELKGKIEDVNAETAFKDELQSTARKNMKFLSELIKEFRPRLYPKDGLKPLTDDNAEKFLLKLKRQDNLYKKIQTQLTYNASQNDEMNAGDLLDDEESEDGEANNILNAHVPISHTDVHEFLKEKAAENLFLINLCNDQIEIQEKMQNKGNKDSQQVYAQIEQTNETIRILSERSSFLQTKIDGVESIMKNMEPAEAAAKEKGTGRQARNQPIQYVELKDDPMYPKLIEKIAKTAGTILGEEKLNAFIYSQSITQSKKRIPIETQATVSVGQPSGAATVIDDSRSAAESGAGISISQTSTALTPTKHILPRKLRHMSYNVFLDVLFKIEEALNAKCEFYNEIAEGTKTNKALRLQFEETQRQAEADLKHQKYLMAKERERLLTQNKYEKDMEKMAKKELVRAEPGKIKMVRSNVPDHAKYQEKKKVDRKDRDVIKYFGDQVDLSLIPDAPTPKPEVQEEDGENEEKMQ